MQANTLGGGGVTLGNPEAQQDYTRQLAEALAQQKSAQSDLGMAGELMQPQYAQNSGALGSLAMVAQAYAGKKLRGKAEGRETESAIRAAEASSGMKMQEGERERSRRSMVAQQMGLSRREAVEFMETGKVPEAKRDRLQAIMSSQGLAIANLDQNNYTLPSEAQQAPPNVRLDPNMSPEERAAAMADIQAGMPDGDQDYRIQKPQGGGPLMPYKDPEIAQQRAAAEARANAQLALAQRGADRADSADSRAAEAARRAAELAERKANQPNAALEQWVEARKGLEDGLGRTDTGPIVGRLPAFTTDQQIAEGSVAATAPILKQLFRTAGEGTFTDKDQELLMKMVPTRTDTEEARQAKIENIDRIIRAKLGGSRPAPSAEDRPQSNRVRIKL